MGCSVEGCGRDYRMTRGLCRRHYERLRKYGDPLAGRILGDDVARFWSKVEKTSGCWLWTGTTTENGRGGPTVFVYGVFSVSPGDGTAHHVRAHRWAYEQEHGPIADGLQLDHRCRNTLCVRPAHLEPVTNRENTVRGRAPMENRARLLRQTHCKHGHEFTPENTRQTPKQRVCLECSKIHGRTHDAKRRRKVAA